MYISNKITLLGLSCDQLNELVNPRNTQLTPSIVDPDTVTEIIEKTGGEDEDRRKRFVPYNAVNALKQGMVTVARTYNSVNDKIQLHLMVISMSSTEGLILILSNAVSFAIFLIFLASSPKLIFVPK